MAMRLSCDFGTISDTNQTFHTTPTSPLALTPSTTGILDTPGTPTTQVPTPLLDLDLDVLGDVLGEIEGKPFSRNFDDLLEGLGLAHPAVSEAANGVNGKRHSGGIEAHDLPDIDDMMSSPDWTHRIGGTPEMSFSRSTTVKRTGPLSIIHEELSESPVVTVPTACLADFEFDFDAFDAPSSSHINSIDNSSHSPSHIHMKNSTLCIRRDTGVKYLMKRKRTLPRIREQYSASSSWMEQTILEMLTTLGAPFVESVRWSFHSGEHNYIVMDHMTNGNLVDLINTNGPLASHQATFYASELISALSYLHSNGIIHRNVEPRSVLLTPAGHILLSDFSHAGYLTHAATMTQRVVDFSKAEKASVAYYAPELLLGWAHDAAVDCWSFGAVFYFLVFGWNPFENQDGSSTHTGIYERILRHPISVEAMRLVHPLARDLISKCLERNPSIRWTMEQLKGHAYFSLTDWDQVSSMRLEVPALSSSPLVKSPPPPLKTSLFQTPYTAPLNPTVRDSQRHLPLGFNLDIYSRQDIAKESMRKDSLQDIAKIVGRRGSLPRALDPVHEDEPLSLNLTGITENADTRREDEIEVVPRQQQTEDALTKAERISRFWDEIDREEREGGSGAPSLNSMEFGSAAPGVPYTKAPKLRKHHSVMQTRHRLFNISTSSFHNILRWKSRSSGTLRDSSPATLPPPSRNYDVQDHDLPMGVHQMGSGIGFTYNVPAAMTSKLSMCSFVPPCHVFSKRFSVPFQRSGGHAGILTNSSPHGKTGSGQHQHIEFDLPSSHREPIHDVKHDAAKETVRPTRPSPTKNAGNGTFLRDMYRSPGWIMAPPENIPSPMPLVNHKRKASSPRHHHNRRASMYIPSAEPLSPATLVNGVTGTTAMNNTNTDGGDAEGGNAEREREREAVEEDDSASCHVNIVIPKNLEFKFDIPHHWAQGSTLRLVPQPTGHDRLEQSFDDSADISMCTLATRGAL